MMTSQNSCINIYQPDAFHRILLYILCIYAVRSFIYVFVAHSKRVRSTGLAKQQEWFRYNVCHVNLPVMVSADTPDSDATDWLRMEQATIIWVNQG